jgi:class 3 adenylate cyclase
MALVGMLGRGASRRRPKGVQVETFEQSLASHHFGLRFTVPAVELDYRAWRMHHVRPFTLFAMYAGALAASLAFVAVSLGALLELRTLALCLIAGAVVQHLLGAAIASSDRFLPWLMPFTATINLFGGLLAVLMTTQFENFAITAGCVTLAAFFGMTLFRLPPGLSFASVVPYIAIAEVIAALRFSDGRMPLNDFIAGVFIPMTALMSGFVVSLAIERVTRRTYHDERIIERQRQALFEERANLARFLSPEVAETIRERGLTETLRRRTLSLSALCIDIRGFTAFTQRNGPDLMSEVLQAYYEVVVDVTRKFGGTVKDFAGDGILILIGAPLPRPDHAHAAVELARQLLGEVGALMSGYSSPDAPLGVGVGISSGECAVGAIGSMTRLEYTAVGTAVNLAARLCSRAEDGQLVMAASTATAVEEQAGWHVESLALKGFDELVPATFEQQPATPAR